MKYEKGTFSITPNKDQLRFKPSELQSIFFWLCEHADDRGQCYPARRTLAKESGVGLKSLDKYTQQLIDEGFITKELRRKPGTKEMMSNLYQILIMPRLVVKKDKPSVETDNTPSGESDNVTIPIINNTHLTILSDVPSEVPIAKEIDPRSRLPDKYGTTTLLRLCRVYSALWYSTYGTPCTSTIGRLGKSIKKLTTDGLTEIQIAVLIHTFFNWHGGGGDDKRENTFLSNSGFPIEMMVKKIDIMVAYLTNSLHVQYTDTDEIRKYAVRVLKDVL